MAEAASEEEVAALVEEKSAPKAEKEADDLTKLTGIGKVGNEKLLEAGITTYAQIAKMSEEEAANFKVKAEAIAEAKELAEA
jgi:predicted flap endonuclease-1-like 5' DNA nuclease